MRILFPLIAATAFAAPALAQETVINPPQSISLDVGAGAAYKPTYPGSDEHETVPWLIFRNLELNGTRSGPGDGFSITPSFNYLGKRDSDDDSRLAGLDEVDRTLEFGVKATYRTGPTRAFVTARKGFGGHDGITGEFGAEYRIDYSDRLTMWAGLEAGYGNDDYNQTYFGVTPDEAARTAYGPYAPGGGINSAAATLEARYDLSPNTAVMGEVKFSRVIGDAADSPIVLDENQPSVRLGIVRTLNFGF
ncbi:outer membrane protein [Paracoccus isoporae]|uniref:Outer membrane protein n=1 Tax=Paracoccus isoporae TaxID=591205 RepID=A0A1G7AHN8_9RHOB|nr:MipA/OmpV family protein [Paracoccus isoporae]SDE14223.1 outer membrane protein [Paracoccus isoporae]